MRKNFQTYTLAALISTFSFVLIANAQTTPAPLPPLPISVQNMMGTTSTSPVVMPPKQERDGENETKKETTVAKKKLDQIVAIEPNGNTVIRGTLVSATTGSLVIKAWGMNFTIDITKVKNAATLDITKFTAGDIVGITGKMSDTGTISAKTILNKEFNARQKLEKKMEKRLEKKDDDKKDGQEKPKLLPPMPPLPTTGAAPVAPVAPTTTQ